MNSFLRVCAHDLAHIIGGMLTDKFTRTKNYKGHRRTQTKKRGGIPSPKDAALFMGVEKPSGVLNAVENVLFFEMAKHLGPALEAS